jgi:hypothetical protein
LLISKDFLGLLQGEEVIWWAREEEEEEEEKEVAAPIKYAKLIVSAEIHNREVSGF